MQRRFVLFVIWFLVTGVAVFVADAAVSSVRDAVTDTPVPLGLPDADRTPTTLVEAIDPVASSTTAGPVTTTGAESSETTDSSPVDDVGVGSATTVQQTTTTTRQSPPTTTAPAPTTSTTAPAESGEVSTHDTEGGWVTLRTVGSDVFFEAAGPEPGWSVDVENRGPEEVVVKFERTGRDDEEITFKAVVDDGKVKVSVED